MDSVNALMSVAGLAWTGQSILGWMQIRQFNAALEALHTCGRVSLGRSSGRFKPRVIVALSVTADGRVSDNLLMKGLSVFSRPRRIAKLNGCKLADIQPALLFPSCNMTQEALAGAVSNQG